ncbi:MULTISPECIES: DUF5997 family protein [unclassified Nocardia]|uniref:DUF5997 family protein n=1 Tax=unclassified Nocardia TaxID=2637762 RepID=UPI0024A8FC6C|nr:MULTISPECIES: DUF5997 family protein [unclassified Nocardia]
MSPDQNSQLMKPLTAADKLGVYLPATPEEFRGTPISRAQLDELRENPPQWLTDLRANGPFPRDITARKLGITNSGLSRAEVADALTAAEIAELLADPPDWLVRERANAEQVRAEAQRVQAQREERRATGNRPRRDRGTGW